MRRVVVTGLGLISPVGIDTESTWEGLLAGRSGAGPITRFDTSNYSVKIACEVEGFDSSALWIGLVGMIVITVLASLGPSLSAARKTVSEILRYQ